MPQPLDAASLERLALRYVERFATSRAKLSRYLVQKLRERGWQEERGEPPIEAVVERLAGLGYVDDSAFAKARAATLTRRGLGLRRVSADLRAAGIGQDDSAEARALAEAEALASALNHARKRKIGPFATVAPDRVARQKALATMLRAGHALDLARKIVSTGPGEEIEPVDT